MPVVSARRSQITQSAVRRDLAALAHGEPASALPKLLYDWLHDSDWVESVASIPSAERRAWLADAGAMAFERNLGGYAAWLRNTTKQLDYIWLGDEREEILRRHTQWLLANLSDIIDFRDANRRPDWNDVTIEGGDHLRAARQQGRGVLVLSIHQSHPGFGFFHPEWCDLGISTVARLAHRGAAHSSLLLDGLRDRVEILPTTAAALRPMLARLSAGGCVAIYGDYLYPGTPGLLTTLFGGEVLMASAAVALALRTRAAVVPVSVARQWPPESGEVRVRVSAPLPLEDLDPRDPTARDNAALRFGITIECLIRANPAVWRLWPSLVDRWRAGREFSQPPRQQI